MQGVYVQTAAPVRRFARVSATAQSASRRGFRPPEKPSEREHRRTIIEASPRHYETDAEGREWLVVMLPPGGELWVASFNAEGSNGHPPDYNGGHDGTDPDSPEAS